MIKIINVSKSFGSVKAVNDVTLNISSGILFGLIGPDGAGKTTMFRLITTLLKPDSGTVSVFDDDTVTNYRKIRLCTGYMPGRFSLYPDLTVEENLSFYATIFGTTIKKNFHLIRPVYTFLEPFHNRLARNLSGGMKQKLALCCALIHNPRLLVLDEPTTGVDAVSRKEFWETLHMLKSGGMSVLVSTPYMDEAAKCDRVALFQEGRIIRENEPAEILAGFLNQLYEVRSPEILKTLKALRAIVEIKRAYLFGQSIHISVNVPHFDMEHLKVRLTDMGIQGISVQKVSPDFEDCFIDAVEHAK